MSLQRFQYRVLLIAALCSGCATNTNLETDTNKENVAVGMQVGLGDCVSIAQGRGLTDTIASTVVSKGINLLGNALTEAGKEKVWKDVGSRNLTGGKEHFPKCVQIVRGVFHTSEPSATPAPAWFAGLSVPGNGYTNLLKNGIWPAERPAFFFEGEIRISEDKTAVTVRPLIAVMYEPQGTRLFRGKTRSVATFFSLATAGTRPDMDNSPGTAVVLGQMQPGRIVRFPAKGAGAAANGSSPYEGPWFTLSEADSQKPLTMTALVAETEPGSPFFSFLGSVFNDDAVKKGVTDQARYIFVPGAAAEARETARKEERSAADDADKKLADALSALTQCHAAADGAAIGKAAEARAALRAYITADALLPTPATKVTDADLNLINLHAPTSVRDGCAALYTKLTGDQL